MSGPSGRSASTFRSLRSFCNIRGAFQGARSYVWSPKSFERLLTANRSVLPPARFFCASDGFALAYRCYGTPSNDIVIVLHGAAGHSEHMHTLASWIADQTSNQVYCLDLRGHGLSGMQLGFEVKYFDQMADDVEEFVASVRAEAPSARIMLAGFSAGGGLAIRVAERLPSEEIVALVLLAPFLGLDSPTTRPGLGGWVRPDLIKVPLLAILNQLGVRRFNNASVVKFNLPEGANKGLEASGWSFNTMVAFGPKDWRTELSAVRRTQPILVVAGDADECFVNEEYPTLLKMFAPHAVVKTIPQCGHWDLLVARVAAEEISSWIQDARAAHGAGTEIGE
jgi:non-heme chloroperoxidase